jgi:hypothetical protein
VQSGPQAFVLQRQLSPQPQLGLQAQPTALDFFERLAGALLILVSLGLGMWVVREDTPYLSPGAFGGLNETATTFRARQRASRTYA